MVYVYTKNKFNTNVVGMFLMSLLCKWNKIDQVTSLFKNYRATTLPSQDFV